jgi:rhodanese-related sulfurtransferase
VRILASLIFIVFLLGFFGCSSQDISYEKTYKNMTVDELHSQMESKDFFLVDTHIPEQRHIKGTDAVISFEEMQDRLDELPKDKNAKIVLYCRSGRMSEIAAEKLVDLGYTNVYNVENGINEWNSKNYELEDE